MTINRILIDSFVKATERAAYGASIFKGKNDITEAFKGVFRRHHPIKNIAYLRLNTEKQSDWLEIEEKLINDYGYNVFQINLLKCRLVKPVLHMLFLAHRAYMKVQRTFFSVKK